ncbi:hypothetical protein [Treponema sp. R8-4-B8]
MSRQPARKAVTSLSIIILNDSSLNWSDSVSAATNNQGMMSLMSGTFSGGNLTTTWSGH